jgi:hypothetical protein
VLLESSKLSSFFALHVYKPGKTSIATFLTLVIDGGLRIHGRNNSKTTNKKGLELNCQWRFIRMPGRVNLAVM